MNVAESNCAPDTLLMVSTDLDGTLLDHHDYSWEPIKPALDQLKKSDIPMIINTSKTAEEVVLLQAEMSIKAPFIIENGSAILLPKSLFKSKPKGALDCGNYWKRVFGSTRVLIVEVIRKLRKQFGWEFVGFSDWDESQLMIHTGLNKQSAHLALQRSFSEPLLWNDTDEALEKFKKEISKYGLKTLQGGRFIHVLGETDKSVPLLWLNEYYLMFKNCRIEWIVLGDSDNDIDMLTIADYPVAVKSPVRDYPNFTGVGETLFTQALGPEGWNQAIIEILENSKIK